MKEFDNLLQHNPHIKNLDAVVGFLRASGYFALRPFLDNINKVRILIGINVDKYIADAANRGELFFAEEGKVKSDYLLQYQQDIETSPYTEEVEQGMMQMVEDIINGKLEVRAHPAKSIHAKIYILYPDGLNEHTIGAEVEIVIGLQPHWQRIGRVTRPSVRVQCAGAGVQPRAGCGKGV